MIWLFRVVVGGIVIYLAWPVPTPPADFYAGMCGSSACNFVMLGF